MRITIRHPASREQGSILAYLVIALVLLSTIATVTAYVAQTFRIASRRESMVQALQYAEGGAAIACTDLQNAFKSTTGTLVTNVVAAGYSLNSSLSTTGTNVFQRTISAPFTNQTVTAQIWMANSASPSDVKVVGQATVASITQTAITHLQIKFGYGAPIISDNPGTTETGISKAVAMDGNVVINGDKTGPIVVDGGTAADAIIANGRVNVDTNYAHIATSAIAGSEYGTANQIPDYTNEGSPNQLFDFNRFIAVANATTGPSTALNNHFTNLLTFESAVKAAKGSFIEGVVVVDISLNDMKAGLDPTDFGGYPLNLHGTLVFNFASTVSSTDKLINTSTLNINPADLSHLVATDSATYTSGYPPTYIDSNKNPANITPVGYPKFEATDDLPAMMYNIGIFDIHGNVNISGTLYSPSFFEIENKQDGQIQYFKGSLITGGGILFENTKAATSIISYDSHVLDQLSTMGSKGKGVFATYWE